MVNVKRQASPFVPKTAFAIELRENSPYLGLTNHAPHTLSVGHDGDQLLSGDCMVTASRGRKMFSRSSRAGGCPALHFARNIPDCENKVILDLKEADEIA